VTGRHSGTAPASDPGHGLPWWKTVLFTGSIFVLVFVGTELILALLGVEPVVRDEDPYVGFSSVMPLFVERERGDVPVMVTSGNKRSFFNRQRFQRVKPEGTYRIFCVGGSTTYGRPYGDRTSFVGWLRKLLPVADPTREWEVINAGGISYASYRIAELVNELAAYDPDLFIVYAGHNEFLERRTYARILETPPLFRSIGAVASHTRIYSVLRRVLSNETPRAEGREVLPGEVSAILDRSVGPSSYERDDGLQRRVLDHYRASLVRMILRARRADARVMIVTPASNLRDCSPFKSEHGSELSGQERARSARLLAEATEAQEQGRPKEALAKLDEAIAMDDRFAHLHFQRGRALIALGRHDEARTAFVRARDEDVCPLRALTEAIDIVRQVAGETDVPVVDFERMAASQAPAGAPGAETFLDHVHPTIEGNRRIALALVDRMITEGIVQPGAAWTDEAIGDVVERVESGLDRSSHGMALTNLSKVLAWAGKWEEADRIAREALEMVPDHPRAHFQLAMARFRQGQLESAIEHFEVAIHHDPRLAPAYENLAILYIQQWDYPKAAHWLQIGLEILPDDPKLHYTLGVTLAEQGKLAQAKAELESALRLDPHHPEAAERLNDVLRRLQGSRSR
jgi:tetratricopeptide (TPR) repeat protein